MKNTIGKEFMKKTQYEYLNNSDQEEGLTQPPIEIAYNEPLIDLPDHSNCKLTKENIRDIINDRRTIRKYDQIELSLEELSFLLWSTQGIKKITSCNYGVNSTYRTVPSAGARHPFETYLLINNVSGLTPGLYRYIASVHKLIRINVDENIADQVVEASYGQVFIKSANVIFIWVVDAYRTTWRYDERGYRYILLDAGHVCQNLYLAGESIQAGVCAVGAFLDDKINQVLNLDGENQFVVYLGTVGKRI